MILDEKIRFDESLEIIFYYKNYNPNLIYFCYVKISQKVM